MANQLYKNFPEIQYKLSDGRIVTIKDFFRKAQINGNTLSDIVDYTVYEIQDGERPDIIASKLYGDGDLHWTLFLANEITNYYDWYMDNQTFENYLDNKYRGQVLVAPNSTDIVSSTSKFLVGEDVSQGSAKGKVLKVDPTFKRIWVETVNGQKFKANQEVTGLNSTKSFTPNSVKESRDATAYYYDADAFSAGVRLNNDVSETGTWVAQTYQHQEMEENEKKRTIKVIRPEFIRRVVSEFERIMA